MIHTITYMWTCDGYPQLLMETSLHWCRCSVLCGWPLSVLRERVGSHLSFHVLQDLMGRYKSMMSLHGMERKPKWSLFSLIKATSSWMDMRLTLLLWSPPTPGTLANPELCYLQQVMPLCMCGTGWTSRPPDDSISFPHGPLRRGGV